MDLQVLVECYRTFVWPILEYAIQVRRPGLTSGQSEQPERVQKHVLRSLLPEAKYSEALAATGLATLEQRHAGGTMSQVFLWTPRKPEFCDWLPWGSPSASDPRAKNTGQRATKGTVLTSQSLSPWCDCRRLGSTWASWRWQGINVGNPL